MAEIVNLRRARKQKARREAAAQAELNRVAFGLSKSEKRGSTLTISQAARALDGHRLEVRQASADDVDTGANPPHVASTIVKHSIVVAGHATSISLEDAFWHGLKTIADERRTSVASLVAAIDKARGAPNLSSAIRVFVLDHYRSASVAALGQAAEDALSQ